MSDRIPAEDMRLPGESFCSDCPDHEACATGYPCDEVRRVAATGASRQRRLVNRFRVEGVPADVPHGSLSTYVNYACRCEDCKAANADWQRGATARRAAAIAADPSLVPHGKASTYRNYGCRCQPCAAAKRASQ